MPEYQEITDTEVQPEAPVTSSLGVRFRDNPIAVWEGAPSAPRINGQQGPAVDTNGLFNGAVTTAKISNGNVTAEKINIKKRSFSGTLDSDSGSVGSDPTRDIFVADAYLFIPKLTTSEENEIRMTLMSTTVTESRLRVANTSGRFDRSYAVEWSYIA